VREVAESSLKFFDWCSNVRNSILHAHHYPLLSGSSDEALHLTKGKNKRSSEQGYLRFDSPNYGRLATLSIAGISIVRASTSIFGNAVAP
jgi:hypothetical protein